jgi:hypothetical protein
MNDTRKLRLLLLATSASCNHKRWYSQYCQLNREGLTDWALGTAFLTKKGEQELLSKMT